MRTLPLAIVFALSVTLAGCKGDEGPQGPQGPMGPQGIPGAAAVTSFGYFYALMPGDNPATVAPGGSVEFPQNGAASGISRTSASNFTLAQVGVYEVSWQVSITEAGQLELWLDSGMGAVELPNTVAGRATGTSQISNHVLVTTTALNSTLSVRNPLGNFSALTVTPLAGGTHPVSASLVIKQIQ
jgi:hypothetical protein